MRRTRNLRIGAASIISALAVALMLAPAAPASAAPSTSADQYRFEVTVVNKSVTRGVVQYGERLATCGSPSSTVECGISVTRSATRKIGVSAGVGVAFVAGQLGISSAKTESISVRCTGKPTRTHRYVVAYAVSDVWSYTVRTKKYDYYSGKLVSTTNSKQWAYDPKGFHCGLSSSGA